MVLGGCMVPGGGAWWGLPPPTATAAGGTHPTEMLSCLYVCLNVSYRINTVYTKKHCIVFYFSSVIITLKLLIPLGFNNQKINRHACSCI